MANQGRCQHGCDQEAQERYFPICKVGQILVFAGVGMAFLSFVLGFWLALLGAALALIGFLVIQTC